MITRQYSAEVEEHMRMLYRALNERDRRRYAAVEAEKLGHGGQVYVAQVLECDVKTIRHGLDELQDPPDLPPGRVRKKGGT